MPSAGCRVRLSAFIWIPQVSFDGEIFSEAVQVEALYLRCLVHLTKSGTSGEWHGACAPQNLGGVEQKHLIDHACSQSCPIDGSSPFDQHAEDFKLSEATENCSKVGTAIGFESWDLLDADSETLQVCLLLFVGRGADDQYVVLVFAVQAVHESRVKGQAQT